MSMLLESATPLTGDAVRSTAASLTRSGDRLADAGGRFARAAARLNAGDWRGLAAGFADRAGDRLAHRAGAASAALTEAGEVMRRCAAELDEAAALRSRGCALSLRDVREQRAAAHARAVLRAATRIGPPLPPYTWDDASPLARAAQRCLEDAAEIEADAVRRAVAQLETLRPAAHAAAPRRTLLDQAVGVGRGAWQQVELMGELGGLLNPVLAAQDVGAWWEDVRAVGSGLAHSARHPREAAVAAAGIDQLREHAYGEWLGGMLAGAAMPGGRGMRAAGVGERSVLRAVGAGGAVVLRRGLRVPAGFPLHIHDLTPDRRKHILDGDGPKKGGGHRSGVGKDGKTEFPAAWSDDDIIASVMRTATRPDRVHERDNLFELEADMEGLTVRVLLSRDGEVLTGHPLPGGRGVVDNPRRTTGG